MCTTQLTQAQQELYDWLAARPPSEPVPSYREMMQAMGLRSPAPIQSRLAYLAAKGWIAGDPGKPRSIKVLRPGHQWRSIPLVLLPEVDSLIAVYLARQKEGNANEHPTN